MWFLAQKKFSAKSVKKWPKYGQKTISRPKKIENVVFGPEKILSQIGQKMAEIWPKDVFMPKRLKSGIGPKKKKFGQIGGRMAEIWPHTHKHAKIFLSFFSLTFSSSFIHNTISTEFSNS